MYIWQNWAAENSYVYMHPDECYIRIELQQIVQQEVKKSLCITLLLIDRIECESISTTLNSKAFLIYSHFHLK